VSRYTLPVLMSRFVSVPSKPIDRPMAFYRWENGTKTVNSGSQPFHFQSNEVSGEISTAQAKLRSGIIEVAAAWANLTPDKLSKCLSPCFVQSIEFKSLKAAATC
jgi:hypothetical protein